MRCEERVGVPWQKSISAFVNLPEDGRRVNAWLKSLHPQRGESHRKKMRYETGAGKGETDASGGDVGWGRSKESSEATSL